MMYRKKKYLDLICFWGKGYLLKRSTYYYQNIMLALCSIDDWSLKTIIIIHRYVQFLDDKKVFQFLGSSKLWDFYFFFTPMMKKFP